jgi:hypothetical protein
LILTDNSNQIFLLALKHGTDYPLYLVVVKKEMNYGNVFRRKILNSENEFIAQGGEAGML